MKRVTRSFTVEYRQTKRPNAGSTKPGWVHAKPALAGVDEKANRIVISAFKTVATHLPADVSSPSIAAGRILPSLVQVALVTEQVDAKGAQTPLKRPAPLDPSGSTAGTSRSEKRTRRPVEKREKFDHASSTSADMPKAPLVTPAADPSAVDKPSSSSRTSRILGRYVFRDERGLGESWKRRTDARRERRS